MPHAALKLIPGVDQNRTLALNEAALSESNLIRFVPDRQGIGLPQKLGGWQKFFNGSVGSVIRALWAWEDTSGRSWLGVGAESSLSVIYNNAQSIITPQTTTANIATSFITVAGSSIITVDATGSGLDNYDVVDIRTQVSVGGLILFGKYPVIALSANQFQIQATDLFGNPKYATASDPPPTAAIPIFDTTSGSASVQVTLPDHGLIAGDTFPVLVATTVGGITLYGNYTVLASPAPTSTTFVITGANTASATTSKYENSSSVTGASGTGATATITYSGSITYPVGSSITVSGINPAGYNGTFTVTSSGTGTVSYANATVAAYVSGGVINSNFVQMVYYNGIGPVAQNAGYGVGGYGTGGYGSGVTAPSGIGTPITAIDWTLDNWGEVFVACPLNGPIYTWSPSNNTPVATIIANAPVANSGAVVAMPQRQIIAWGSTFNGVQDALLVRWCDVDNYDVWAPQVTNQAGSFRIPKGSKVVQCIQGPQQTLVWTDLGVWAMQYVGPPYVYQINELGTGCGLIGRRAAASMGGVVYWMGQSQFFRLSGSGVEPIRCPIWDVIFQDLDTDNLDKIRVAPNSRFGEISWYYPTNSNGGEINSYVKYNILLDQWDFGTLSRTAWINESVLGPPIGAAPNYYIYQHETSPDADGMAMNSYFQTGYFAMTEADVKIFVDQIWPDMKWGYYGGAQNAQVSITFYVADYPGQTPLTYGPYTMTQASTYITPRFRGRLTSIKVESDDIGSWWRIGNIRYRLQQDGKY